jgi:hypothetical protein
MRHRNPTTRPRHNDLIAGLKPLTVRNLEQVSAGAAGPMKEPMETMNQQG